MEKKNEILRTILTIWFLATTGYVVYDFWNEYKTKGIQNAYNLGLTDTVNKLIQQVESSQCQPVEVFSGEKKLQVVSAQCLPVKQEAQAEKQK